MNKQLSIAVTLCALTGSFSAAQAQVMCGDTITTSQVLTSDLTCTMDDPALTIQGPGRLDMRGFTVSCGGSGTNGIVLTGTGALLQNGTVAECLNGVVLGGSNHRVQNGMLLRNNRLEGLELESGSGHRITQTTARDSGGDGFDTFGDGGNFFTRNRATNNGIQGFEAFSPGAGDTYTRNVASGNGRFGFVVSGNDTLSQNVAQGNTEDGFLVIADNNRLTRNSARNNLGDGIEVINGALNNTLQDNTGSGNGSGDLDVDGGFDLEDDNPDCDNNTWTNNRGTRNRLCIR